MNIEERIKFLILNFIINYSIGFFIFLVFYNLFKGRLMHSNFYINMYITPAIMSFFSSIHIWFATRYEVIKLPTDSENNLKRIANFSNSNRIKKLNTKENVDIYKMKNLYSCLPIKLRIMRTESHCIITAPKTIIKELLGKEFLV